MAVGGGIKADQLGVLLSGMSASTAATVLGRSPAWVQARRAELQAVPTPFSAPVPAPTVFLADFGCGPCVDPEAAANHRPPAPAARPAQPASAAWLRPRSGVERLRPLTHARLRFCRWFLAAGWPVQEVASLFDLDVERLAEALP